MNFQKMTKKQLEEHGRSIGIELDRRKTKKDLIAEIKKATAKKPVAKKTTAKKPVAKKTTAKKPVAKTNLTPSPTQPVKQKTLWDKIKDFFSV